MNIYSICAIAIIGALICVLLKQYRPEIALLTGLGVAVFIFFGIVDKLIETVGFFKELADKSTMSAATVTALLKCLGICVVTSFASDTCKDAGEIALSTRIETYGKIAAFAVTLPLFKEFIELIIDLCEV